jgi:hypothetical protein
MTGLMNRRCFETALEAHVAHCKRYGPAGAVLTLDLDHFKVTNDDYGHNIGDQVAPAPVVSWSRPEPSAFITQMFVAPPRALTNTILWQFDDHAGVESTAELFVRFIGFVPSAFITKMSPLPARLLVNRIFPHPPV